MGRIILPVERTGWRKASIRLFERALPNSRRWDAPNKFGGDAGSVPGREGQSSGGF